MTSRFAALLSRTCRLLPAAMLALGLCCFGNPALGQEATPAAAPALASLRDAVVADLGAEIVDGLPSYLLEASFHPGDRRNPGVISGDLSLTVPGSQLPASRLFLRLYPNDPGYGDGGMTLRDVAINGTPAKVTYSVEDTVAEIDLPESTSGGEVTVTLGFTTAIPVHSRHAFGMFSVNPDSETIALAHWYPMLAGIGPDGPDLSPPSQIGDPVFSGAALFDVRFTAPSNLTLISPGETLTRSENNGEQTIRVVAGPAREFPIVAGANLAPVTVDAAGGVVVTSWSRPEFADGSRRIAKWAAEALAVFEKRFGPYPYTSLDVVEMGLYGAAGMEFPGMVLIAPATFLSDDGERRFGEMVVAHEVAHQWWYALVSNNQNAEAFIDEGLSEYAAAEVYFEDRYGLAEGRRQFDLLISDWMDQQLASGGDVVVDIPTEAFPDRTTYSAAVYAKASLGYDAIRAEIGDEAFFRALRDLAATRKFDVVDGADVEGAFSAACGCDIAPTWDEWFRSARLEELRATPAASR